MNNLQHETSPYLLQHAHNPVDWYAWKPEAFEKARLENKPILVSIGYSTCHWCHVMERESFENKEVAAFMNEHFVNIKVDREERPDVDQIYMEACQIISGSGGWPLNCFLLPDGRPFYAGTYFPPEGKYNRPSWTQVLQNLSNAYNTRRETVESQAARLVEVIQKSDTSLVGNQIEGLESNQIFTPVILQNIFHSLKNRFDSENGGFGGAPKFPGTMSLEYLLNYAHFFKDETARKQVELSLDKMIMGGIYDQIGGGFARYSVDAKWLVPHFEKMLYDNALLIALLSEAYKLTKKEIYKETIEETLEWVEREMTSDEGGFFSALDADSEGVEGKFYIWDKQEIEEILGKDADLFCQFYDVSKRGNWEGKNILNRKQTLKEFAHWYNVEEEEVLKSQIKEGGKKLLEVRAQRIRPGLDDKILLDWNALQCTAYAKAYSALGNEKYKEAAERNLKFLLNKFSKGQESVSLFHTYKNADAQYDAFLNDYAFLIEAILNVYEISFDTHLLKQAELHTEYVLKNFLDEATKLFYFTSSIQKDLIVRRKDLYDSAIPSGNSTMIHNLQKLGVLLGKENYKELASEMLMNLRDAIEKYPSSFGKWSTGLMNQVFALNEIAIVGENANELANEIIFEFLPNRVLMATEVPNDDFPLLEGKISEEGTHIYICKNYACQKPVKTIEEFRQLVN
ncbi:MAG: thioredoxin domain-containing protein [Bacteroidetes bacterium]|jgi:uncharacterized protein YyaL (SSP411 family)|nr:thioredoxin domain-containing protein [Bacteroidota bacterium]